MRFLSTTLDGALAIELVPISDERGYFVRTFCTDGFAEQALETTFVQHSMSHSTHKGTVRGMHFQRTPHAEAKLVRCVHGAIYDVLLDLRPHSSTFMKWEAFELSADNHRQLYVPKGFAHGFQSLTDDAEVLYLISTRYAPAAATGVRYDDRAFAIGWPLPVAQMSDKDRTWADWTGAGDERLKSI